MSQEPGNDGKRAVLDEVLADYMRRVGRGEQVDQQALIAAHPELASELRDYFSKAAAVENISVVTADFSEPRTDRPADATIEFERRHDLDLAQGEGAGESYATAAGERFRKIRLHAVGGLGEVSLAHDQQLNRVVALKELQQRYSTDEGKKARFQQEGEITGSLEHPGIVPVYAMGQDDAGRPFYAMRFIRGESLREAIRRFHAQFRGADAFNRNSLDLRRLLGRFIDVCNAIGFAHNRGTLHRDMKPENVMLGKFGETLVVDWGMARGSSQPEIVEPSEETVFRVLRRQSAELTTAGSTLGTPAYMSPEAAAGNSVQLGPASDIFSLGATLYCLLTNRPPFQAESLTELLQKAERAEFPRSRTVNPRVPRALDAICCHAMALEPADRYASALELAGDVERWLGDEAVTAYRERPHERLFRWVRRHRTWAMAGAATVCIVTLVSLMATALVNRARERAVTLAAANAKLAKSEAAAHAEAVKRFAESRETVDKWLTGFTEAVQYYPGVQPFRDRMLSQAADQYKTFAGEVSGDPGLELERGRTLVRLGDLQRSMLQPEAARESYAQAATVFAEISADDSNGVDPMLERAIVRVRQGMLDFDVGQLDAAEVEYRQALEEMQAVADRGGDHVRVTASRVDANSAYGSLLALRGDVAAAEPKLREAIDLQTSLVRAMPANVALVGPLAEAQIRLGQLLLQLPGGSQAALDLFTKSLEYWDRLVELQPDHPEPRQSRAVAQINLASALRLAGRYGAEADAYRAAIADYDALVAAIPDNPLFLENRALTETDLGQLLFELGQPRQAVDILTKAKEQLTALSESHGDVVRFQEEVAVCLDNLGQAQADLGQRDEALESHESAEVLLGRLTRDWPELAPYRERRAICRSHIGQVLAARGDRERGLESLQSAIKQLEQLRALDPQLPSTCSVLAIVHAHRGDVLEDDGQSQQAREA